MKKPDPVVKELRARIKAAAALVKDHYGVWVETPVDPKCQKCGGSGKIDDSFENGHNGDWVENIKTCGCKEYLVPLESALAQVLDLKNKNWKTVK